MALSNDHKDHIYQVLQILHDTTPASGSRRKRRLVEPFLELLDREHWAEYYEVVPNPRCLNGVKRALERDEYKNALQVYEDLNLVFLNALFYNEEESQISRDTGTLKRVLDDEWRKRPLPPPPEGLPATSAQIVHGVPLPAHITESRAKDPSPSEGEESHLTHHEPDPPRSPTHPTTTEPKSPLRLITPEPELDVGGTPEPETSAQDMALDGESDAIVQQLEKGLPRWEGFAEVGWSNDIPEARYSAIFQAILDFTNDSGTRLAASLESIPEDSTDIPYKGSLSLSSVERRLKEKHYKSCVEFDKDMALLFLKGRRWFEPGSEDYGNVLILQRFYQALVSSDPPSGPPYSSSTHFAALPAAPGTAKPLNSGNDVEGVPGVTTFRVGTKDRTFVDGLQYKGWNLKLADWLHLANCDDPSRPIIGQIFRLWHSEEPARKGRPGMTVCWYFRPEQTFHPAQRQFWENEIFKTSHFADHPVEDIIEKVACQFTARHIRGRPRPPYWYPGWPLYVCDSRYNDRERIFVKIKNWASCVPEEVRKDPEYSPIYPFERPVFPRRYASPFIGDKPIKAPGGIGDVIERAEGEKLEGGGIGRKRTKKNTPNSIAVMSRSELTDRVGQSRGLYVGPPLQATTPNAYQYQLQQQYSQTPAPQNEAIADRTLMTAAGGVAGLGSNVAVERLPAETAKHFDRDPETNEVLWFAAPPLDIAHAPGPQYSLEYLTFLAKKHKNAKRRLDAMDVDTSEAGSPKRAKAPSVAAQ